MTGNFDGMGISLGVLQWNIGSGSLQPMVLAVGRDVVVEAMPKYGDALWEACSSTLSRAKEIVVSWQNGTRLKPDAARELAALMGTERMRAVQSSRIAVVAEKAIRLADDWATGSGRAGGTDREKVWFFDLLTQNGGMKGVRREHVDDFIVKATPEGAVDVICGWLDSVPAKWFSRDDCLRNAQFWRDKVAPADLQLFVLSYLRSSIAGMEQARGNVMNRKGTLALGRGHVNGRLFDLRQKI